MPFTVNVYGTDDDGSEVYASCDAVVTIDDRQYSLQSAAVMLRDIETGDVRRVTIEDVMIKEKGAT